MASVVTSPRQHTSAMPPRRHRARLWRPQREVARVLKIIAVGLAALAIFGLGAAIGHTGAKTGVVTITCNGGNVGSFTIPLHPNGTITVGCNNGVTPFSKTTK